MIKQNIKDRFESKVYHAIDGCHYWLGHINPKGYGDFRIAKNMGRAHRFSYTLYNGEIPNGFCVLHSCDNPSCVNPNHLFLGTNKDNVNDKCRKKRQFRPIGDRHPRAKLSSSIVMTIRSMKGVMKGRDIAAKYSISTEYVFEIWSHKAWKHI